LLILVGHGQRSQTWRKHRTLSAVCMSVQSLGINEAMILRGKVWVFLHKFSTVCIYIQAISLVTM
jgi:hypothetical protein